MAYSSCRKQDILEDGGESLLSATLPEPEALNLAPGGMKLPKGRATDMPWRDAECVRRTRADIPD